MHTRIYPAGWRPGAAAVVVATALLTILFAHRPHAVADEPRQRRAFVPSAPASRVFADQAMAQSGPLKDQLEMAGNGLADKSRAEPESPEPASFRFPDLGTSATEAARMIIRSGFASIEVRSVDSVTPMVRVLADQIGGYVANSSIEGGREQARTARFEIKAPAQNFDRLVNGLAPLGKLESVNVTAEDVGEEFVDVNARMANDRRLEDRLIQLLQTRTGRLKDVLDVEHELARVREEIERQEGRLRYLRTRADLSTLTVTIHEPVPIINRPGVNPINLAVRRAWRNFVELAAFAIASLGFVIPIGLVGAAGWVMFGRRRPVAVALPTPTAASGS